MNCFVSRAVIAEGFSSRLPVLQCLYAISLMLQLLRAYEDSWVCDLQLFHCWKESVIFPCVDTGALPITTLNYHISQFFLVCDNSYSNHIHIHAYTFTSLFKHCSIFTLLCRHERTQTHMLCYIWTGLHCASETRLVIKSINYLRNFQLCKYW